MNGAVQAAVVEVEAKGLDDCDGKRLLVGFVEGLPEGCVGQLAARADLRQKRDRRPLQGLEDGFDLGGRRTGLVEVVQRVEGVLVVAVVIGLPQGELEQLFERRLEMRKVALAASLRPDVVPLRPQAAERFDELARELAGAIVAAPAHPQQRCFVAAGRVIAPLEPLEQSAYFRVGHARMDELGERRELLGAGLGSALGHVGLLIPRQERSRLLQIGNHAQTRLEVGP